MTVFRYLFHGNFTQEQICGQIPQGATVVIAPLTQSIFIDIDITDTSAPVDEIRADLDNFMIQQGWSFVEQDPSTPLPLTVSGSAVVSSATITNNFANTSNNDPLPNGRLFNAWRDSSPVAVQGGYTFTNEGVIVPEDGTYYVSAHMFFTSTSPQRPSVGMQLDRDGALVGPVAASGYIRRADGHDESSNSLGNIPVVAAAGDRIGVRVFRLARTGTVNNPQFGSQLTVLKVS